MSVTVAVDQLPISWSKALASASMALISVTLDVTQLPIGWLNDVASASMHAAHISYARRIPTTNRLVE